jgi:MtrB/PioB family decaheme-associated outer membrane protein
MRTRFFGMAAALLLVSSGATAQEQTAAQEPSQQIAAPAAQRDVPAGAPATTVNEFGTLNQIDFGVRATAFDTGSDRARFQRFRDVRDGLTLDRFRFSKATDVYLLDLQADHLGYRDQRLFGSYNNYGRVKASFEWNQTPLFYSRDTRTLYSSSAPGVLTLPDSLQSALQNKTGTLTALIGGAGAFDLRSQRDEAKFNLVYSANRFVDVTFDLRNLDRNGSQAYGAGFGFSNAIELAVPIDTRTTELGAGLEWSNQQAFARLDYLGSFFRNHVPTLMWDNPLRLTDSATAGPAAGRLALWPNSDSNAVSASGSVKLPARSRATAYLSIGNLTQNDPLIPYTTNSALASPALSRPTADLVARVTSMNYTATSRPTNSVWVSARYRQYRYDNRSTPFFVAQSVNYDTSAFTLNENTPLLGYTRHTFDGDVSFTPFTFVALRAGYTREDIDRSFRIVEQTTEDTGRLSVDLTGVAWVTLRGIYEIGNRRGSAVNGLELLAIGEQPALRQFDIADRDHRRVTGIVTVTPIAMLSFNGSLSVGKETYPGTVFGLRDNDNHVYSVGVDVVPGDLVNFGVTYGWEKYTALQASRTANPLPANTVAYLNDPTQQFNDPRRNWTDSSADTVRTFNASMELLKPIPKTEVTVGYDYSRARSTYVYALAPNAVVAEPSQLPAVVNALQRGTVDVRYFVTRRIAVGGVYWYDKYSVDDFALGPTASLAVPTASPTLMLLGNFYRPYAAHTFTARLTYLW